MPQNFEEFWNTLDHKNIRYDKASMRKSWNAQQLVINELQKRISEALKFTNSATDENWQHAISRINNILI